MISLNGISKRYGPAPQDRALEHIDLEIDAGEYIMLTGRSGSGKTTLLNILGMLASPDTGGYSFDGVAIDSAGQPARDRIRVRRIGYIFHDPQLVEELSVIDNIALGLRHSSLNEAQRHERIQSLLMRFDLGAAGQRRPSQLARAQQQCVAVARAVSALPRVLLADEPTATLDARQAEVVLRTLRTLHGDGSTVIVATHAPAVAAQAARKIELAGGRVVLDARHAVFA